MKYEKAKIIAKNLPSGSYAAGCPSKDRGSCVLLRNMNNCAQCDRAK